MQGDNLAFSVRERKQVAIAELPRVLAGILDRRRVRFSRMLTSRVGRPCGSASSLAGSERPGLSGRRCGRPVGFAFGLGPEHYKESGGSERSRKQHKPQQQLGAQSQIVVALKEGLQNAVYPSELNKLPQGMRGLRKVSWSCHGR